MDVDKETGLPKVRCVLIGDSGVGKTSLLAAYSAKDIPAMWDPDSLVEEYTFRVLYGGDPHLIELRDTTGDEKNHKIRVLELYPALLQGKPDVFLICYSVGSWASFRDVVTKWIPELSLYFPKTPFLLIGTQADLRKTDHEVTSRKLVTMEEGMNLAESFNAFEYLECSALTGVGVKKVLDEGILAALEAPRFRRRKNGKKCLIV